MSRVSKKLHRREQLILALLQQPTLEKAAKAAGISAVTAWRISRMPKFEEELRQARRAAFGQAIAKLQYGSSAAVDTLMTVMSNPKTPAGVRVRAAEKVLEYA